MAAAVAAAASKSREAVRVGWAVGVDCAGEAWTSTNGEIGGRPR